MDDANPVRTTSGPSHRAWIGATALALACVAAAITPSRWMPYVSTAALSDEEWRRLGAALPGAAEDEAARSDEASGVRITARPATAAGGWVLAASAPDPRSAEAGLARRLLVLEAPAQPAGPAPLAGPWPPLAPAEEAAVELLSQARLAEEEAAGLPMEDGAEAPEPGPRSVELRGALATLDAERARAAARADATRLAALLPLVGAAERAWAREAGGGPAAARLQRLRLLRRATESRAQAATLSRPFGPARHALTEAAAEWRWRESRAGRPAAATAGEEARVVPRPWVAPARRTAWPRGAMALGGAVIGFSAGALLGRRRRAPAGIRAAPWLDRPGDAERLMGERCHWVSGARAADIAGGVCALAARAVMRGDRVLVVDAGRRLGLHRNLRGEHRWGLGDCARQGLPVLGLVQETGVEQLHFLARGEGRVPSWEEVRAVILAACPHFDRILVGVDPGRRVARRVDHLGWEALGWWALPRPARPSAPARARIPKLKSLSPIWISSTTSAMLEAAGKLRSRVRQRPRMTPVVAAPAQPVAAGVPEPLDCDLQVRERLRFMAWVRQVAAENRPRDQAPPAPEQVAELHA